MDNEKIWHLLILKLSGEATESDLNHLTDLLERHPHLAVQAAAVEAVWKRKTAREKENTDELFNRHLQRLSDDTEENTPFYHAGGRPQRWRSPRLLWGAAAAAACLAIVYFLATPPGKGSIKAAAQAIASGNSITTRNGSKSKLQLPDGTQVWLNSGSNLSYDNDFGTTTRQVKLCGEAFFDVVKDNAHPFIIQTSTVEIRVLGTAFNVRSYPEEKATATSLIRGAVEIVLKSNADKKIFLKPNEKLIVSNDSSWFEKDSVRPAITHLKPTVMTLTQVHHLDRDSIASEVQWTRNKLVFDGETLSEVALKLERWSGVKVTIEGEELKNTEYTGVFSDDNLTDVLVALQLSGNFKYVVRKNEVIIRP